MAQSRRSERVAWWTAGGGWLCALMSAASLMLLMPLKRVDPFIVRVDNTTGVVDVVPEYSGHGEVAESVTRYLLTHYVTVCERFNFATAESDYQECGAFHSALRNQSWYALWNPASPTSPLNLYKDGVDRARPGGLRQLLQEGEWRCRSCAGSLRQGQARCRSDG